MNPKINKLKAEREKNSKKIAALRSETAKSTIPFKSSKIWILSAWCEAAA